MKKHIKKVLIVAGGTGGHIFPALAFGEWIQKEKKAESVIYLSGNRALELEIYRSRGVEPICLSLGGSPIGASSVFLKLRRCAELFFSFLRVGVLLCRERPDVCFLFGSYVSLPPLFWSLILRISVILHEQNSCAGKVTRLASFLGVPIASGWGECRGLRNFTPVGVPIRDIKKIPKLEAARALDIDISGSDFVVGVIGGSIGSASLENLIGQLARDRENFIFAALGNRPSESAASKNLYFLGKHWDMTLFYSVSDVVVCRAGASTLAELMAYDVQALVVPWTKAADGHQELNAQNFSRRTGNPIWIQSKIQNKIQNKTDSDYYEFDKAFEKLIEKFNEKKTPSQPNQNQSDLLWRVCKNK